MPFIDRKSRGLKGSEMHCDYPPPLQGDPSSIASHYQHTIS